MFKRASVVTHGLGYFFPPKTGFEASAELVDSCRHDDFVYQGLDQAISELTAIHARL